MNSIHLRKIPAIIGLLGLQVVSCFAAPPAQVAQPAGREIPDALKPWRPWALWNETTLQSPRPFNDPEKPLSFWPSALTMDLGQTGGTFQLGVTVFDETWVSLPGGREHWPLEAQVNGGLQPVMERNGLPSLKLPPGAHRITGKFQWSSVPQSLLIPKEVGILALNVDGRPAPSPTWNEEGLLWLRRDGSSGQADKDFLSIKVYAVLEDGIPLWLKTQIELMVSGKSREEDIGYVLPAGWRLSGVRSALPVAVDDAGNVKAQVRAGKWTIEIDAFRLDDVPDFRFAPGIKPAVSSELIAFRSKPDFRMVDISGIPAVDVSQTTFPEQWRSLPVFYWDTAEGFQVVERMRGMGTQKPAGLNISREFWLDEDGKGITFRDRISGQMQQIWRLDAAPGQEPGAVRSHGQGQLITRNPETGAPGIEIRSRNLDLEATGRMEVSPQVSATGWRTNADGLTTTLNLPPGWRLFALFGADWVRGDWLTAWSLLDLFLLLIFSLAVFRLFGFGPAVLAFVAFALSYHEPSAPKFLWLLLLIPLALLRAVKSGWPHRLLVAFQWIVAGLLLLALTPFVATQIQQAIYPQLEKRTDFPVETFSATADISNEVREMAPMSAPVAGEESAKIRSFTGSWGKSAADKSNMLYDANARIQTGPAVPDWTWRSVSYGWNGPVQASQRVHAILVPITIERLLTVLRVALLLILAWVFLRVRPHGTWFKTRNGAIMPALAFLLLPLSANAQFPNQNLLETLRERLTETSDAYPTAADIPMVSLTLDSERNLVMDVEIHTAIETAVPLPGRLPAWSPVRVTVAGQSNPAVRRQDGFLWIVLPAGVHRVKVEGVLAAVTEWEWTFLLKPHFVKISATGWAVSGVKPDGMPDQQVFFVLQQKTEAGSASYDRQDFQSVVVVDRRLELGLVWQVHTKVRRLSPPGKAISLKIPLLPGENVLSANAVLDGGTIEVRLGAQDSEFSWDSELSVSTEVEIHARRGDSWVERWSLAASPVWNVSFTGLQPVFEPGNPELLPVWTPWPGEAVTLFVSRPEAIPGATITVSKVAHQTALGNRQRTSQLDLTLRCTLGEDFPIKLPDEAEVTSLEYNGQQIPVRKDAGKVIVPVRPGDQSIAIAWTSDRRLNLRAGTEKVELPVPSANISTTLTVPSGRWVLWTNGPLRGPAVRFWVILACSLLAALILGRLKASPLRTHEWLILSLGLTQVPLPAALIVVGWLFFLVWRGRPSYNALPNWGFNTLQVGLILLTVAAMIVFVAVVGEGLLGNPEMFIIGNGSTPGSLQWFQPRSDNALPSPSCLSVSIWWYRILMLLWALWLAASLIRWLRWAWHQFSAQTSFRMKPKAKVTPPPIS
jgi:hypothetical protein